MKRILRKIKCWLGLHHGYCDNGAYRCLYCDFSDPYDLSVTPGEPDGDKGVTG